MKIVKIIFVSFFILILVIVAAVVVFIKTFDINRYKPQIVQSLHQAIQKDVSLGDLSLRFSLTQGVVLSINAVSLVEDKDPLLNYSMKVESVLLDIDVMAFLKTRQVVVSRVNIVSPQINVIRKTIDNFSSQKSAGKEISLKDSLDKDMVVQKAGVGFSMPTLMIKTIQVSNGRISFVDKNFPPELKVDVDKFDLEIKDFFLDKPFKIQSSFAVFSPDKNVSFQSQAQLDLKTQHIRLDDAVVETDLSSFSVEQMKKNIPQIEALPIDGNLTGKVVFKINQLVAGQEGMIVLSSNATLKDGRVKIANLGIPLENITATADITETDIILKELLMNLGSGRIKATSRVSDYVKAQEYSFDVDLEAIQLSELLAPYHLPVKAEGRIVGNLKGQGKGFTPEALKTTLTAEGMVRADETQLVDFNLLRFVLDKISMIPNLAEKIEAQLPDNYKKKMTQKNTIFKKVNVAIQVKDGKLLVAPLMVDADDFILQAQGSVDFNQNAQFEFEFYISEELSQYMVSSVEQLSYLLEEDNKIHIPLVSYQGPIIKMMIYPDLAKLGKKIIITGAKQELKKAIFKALKIENTSQNEEQGVENNDSESVNPQNSENSNKIIINNVLDAIFK
jgi:hypothetical protein